LESKVGVILLAGGIGSRMESHIPKQFMLLDQKPIARHSFDLFSSLSQVVEIVVVCHPKYQSLFARSESLIKITFALPGERRQDSVYNGLQALSPHADFVCIHDAARPFVTQEIIQRALEEATEHGAAAVGMPVKYTVKEIDLNGKVICTPDRSCLWEIQTPQVIQRSLLQQGFEHIYQKELTVTDDVSIIEHLGLPVKVIEGCYRNLKITTPDDLAFAQTLFQH
jgi:2-C-methyl-D-erythritol 4-phosphate cytidylyltransferase